MKRVCILTLVTVMLFSLTIMVSAQPKITMTTWGEIPEFELYENWFDEFEEETGIPVELITYPADEYQNRISTAIAGGRSPDLIRTMTADIMYWLLKDVYVPLNSYLESSEGLDYDTLDSWNQPILDQVTFDEKIYTIPQAANTYAMYYNKELFREAGLEFPDESWKWEDLRSAAKKITDKFDDVNGFAIDDSINLWFTFAWQNGGRILSEDKQEAVFNSPEVVEAWKFLHEMRHKDKSMPLTIGTDMDHQRQFQMEKVAMIYTGAWMRPTYRVEAPELDYGISVLPYQKERANWIAGGSYGISQYSDHKEEVWKLITFLVRKEQQMQWSEDLQTGLPVREDAMNAVAEETLNEPFVKELPNGRIEQMVPNMGYVYEPLEQAIEEIFLNPDADIQALLDETAPKVTKRLQETWEEFDLNK